jgi:DNA-binding CsgD family transcriptional regulator
MVLRALVSRVHFSWWQRKRDRFCIGRPTMRSRAAAEARQETSSNESLSSCPEVMIRSLIRQLLTTGPLKVQTQDAHSEEVIGDVEVNGSRYLLVRLPRSNESPVSLSPREQEIVRMVAQGHPNKVIAAVLNISCWTVCTHLRRIFAKLGVGSRAAMVARLLKQDNMHPRGDVGPETSSDGLSLSAHTSALAAEEAKLDPRTHRRDPVRHRAG